MREATSRRPGKEIRAQTSDAVDARPHALGAELLAGDRVSLHNEYCRQVYGR